MLAKIEQKSPPIPMQPKVSVGMQHADRAPLNRAIESGAHSHRALRPSFCTVFLPCFLMFHIYSSTYANCKHYTYTGVHVPICCPGPSLEDHDNKLYGKNWCLDHLWAYFWGGEHDDDEDRPENTLPSALSLLNAFSTSSFSSQKRILFTFCSSAVPLWR